MFLISLWCRAAGRPVSDRSHSAGSSALRQALRPCGPPRGAGAGRWAGFLLCASVLLVLGWPVPGSTQTTPTVTISWDAQAAWLEPSFTVTFTFSEAVTGFMGEDREDLLLSTPVLLTGANFQALSADDVYH